MMGFVKGPGTRESSREISNVAECVLGPIILIRKYKCFLKGKNRPGIDGIPAELFKNLNGYTMDF